MRSRTRVKAHSRANTPAYKVNPSLKAWDLAKASAAITLKVHDRDGIIGTMQIGQGTLGWKKAGARSFQRINWREFAKRLNDL